MIAAVDKYLALRRSAGFSLSNAQYLLHSFAAFAADHQQQHVRLATLIDWASRAPSTAQRHARYQTVGQFAEHVHREDPRHELPPPNHFGPRKTRRVPRIYTALEIDHLVLAAAQLSVDDPRRPQTYATLISLLAATGLRISEALHLRYGDVTPDGLLIRKTKFQKSRLVPLHETAAAGLGQYLAQRRPMPHATDHVFIDDNGRPLGYGTVYRVFARLAQAAGIPPLRGHRPRLHELRHNSGTRIIPSSAPADVRPCSQRLPAANGSDSTCWRWPPISAT
jgi:integrase/recombinase XerD